jgi:hypothetical protein
MTATRDKTIAARVPGDLRDALEELARLDGHGEISITIRAALREYTDRRYGRAGVLDAVALHLDGRGSARRNGTPTEIAAALRAAPRIGTQRRRILELYSRQGAEGFTADDVLRELEHDATYPGFSSPAPNGVARRVTDLLQGDLIRPALTVGTSSWTTRATRHGAQATIYVITAAGIRALEDARQREAARAQENAGRRTRQREQRALQGVSR